MKKMKLIAVVGLLILSHSHAAVLDEAICQTHVAQVALNLIGEPLMPRADPGNRTSGRVPHVQIDAIVNESINNQLRDLAFALPGVEKRPTVVSLPGGLGMWLKDDVPVSFPGAIVAGREFTHIHVDGSSHAPLPFERAIEVVEHGWGERHPWAQRFDGWEGLVMLFSPRSSTELTVVFQLIVESFNHVTGQNLNALHCE